MIAICLFVAGLAAFPSGRRSEGRLPIEVVVLAAAFAERGISTYLPGTGLFAPAAGSMLLLIVALVILAFRLRIFAPVVREVHSA